MESEKPFSRVVKGPDGFQVELWAFPEIVLASCLSRGHAEEIMFRINAAHDKAVREATEKLQAHNDHLQRMFNLPSARKDIAEAEARVWEECARFVEDHFWDTCGQVGEAHGKAIAAALRSKKSTPEPREGEGR